MAETSHDIRQNIELTRQRMSDTLAALEAKVRPARIVQEHPFAVLAAAFGVGVLLGRSGPTGAVQTIRSSTADARRQASTMFDGVIAGVATAVTNAATQKVQALISDLGSSNGATPPTARSTGYSAPSSPYVEREVPVASGQAPETRL
jgi:hypothetical protein